MKTSYLLILAISLISTTAHAQSQQRDSTIKKIEAITFSQANVYTADSPIVSSILNSAKAANTGVGADVWEKIKPELAVELAKSMSENGGPMGGVLTGKLNEFSDKDLDDIVKLLSDPLYKKFQVVLGSPDMQMRIMQASGKTALTMSAVLNTVLLKHGLRQIR